MITDGDIEIFRKKLIAELAELTHQDAAREQDRAPIELDQQSVGRLSRMDAIQQQAMAQAASRRRALQATRIRAALDRINEGEFGYCTDCGDEIARGRLDHDPAVPRCLSCATG